MGYLDVYGAGEDRRGRLLKRLILALVAVVVIGTVAYFNFRDYPEERQVARFLELLRAGDYKSAYALWGCTDAKPCRDYRFERFMEDWGPQSEYKRIGDARVVRSNSCDTGIIQTLEVPGAPETVGLFVERSSDTLSFAPWQLKPLPNDARSRFKGWMWNITRNCNMLIGP